MVDEVELERIRYKLHDEAEIDRWREAQYGRGGTKLTMSLTLADEAEQPN